MPPLMEREMHKPGPYGNDGGFGGFRNFGGSGGFRGGAYRSNNGNGYQEFHFEGGDMGDIFENFFWRRL